jgi:hypothetical protein
MSSYAFFFYVRRYFPATMLFLFAVYWTAVFFVHDYYIGIFMRAGQTTISGSVLFALRRSIYSVFADDYETIPPKQWPEHVATWGALLFWSGLMLNGAWLLIWQIVDPTSSEIRMPSSSPVNGFFLMLVVVGGLLKAAAPPAIGGVLASSARWLIVVALTSALAMTLLGTRYSEELRRFTDRLAPLIRIDERN